VATTGATAEKILISVLIERDGTTCSLCPAEIDFTLKHPHPGSKSLDHIIPISAGGSHTYDNVALAHLVCNISKNVGEAPKTRYSDLVQGAAT
jgi:5-methylcytosine-specific restriction endonuclease McrA